jgi:hypothetical protein
MLLPKEGMDWKAARSKLPPIRTVWATVTKLRLAIVAITAIIILIVVWDGYRGTANDWQR